MKTNFADTEILYNEKPKQNEPANQPYEDINAKVKELLDQLPFEKESVVLVLSPIYKDKINEQLIDRIHDVKYREDIDAKTLYALHRNEYQS